MVYWNRNFSIFFILLLFTSNTYSQNFTGKIVDENSNPIAGSAVLIKEANQGLACTENGGFQTTLLAGEYHIEYRCIGYESYVEKLLIKSKDKIHRHVVLKEKPIMLQEVVISRGEDPAYAIMRKAIEKASYHQNLAKEYDAESYTKGNAELTKVGRFVDKIASVEGLKMSDIQGNLFVQESYSNISFKAPDQYEQTVKAFTSSMPDDLSPDNAIRLTQTSLYLPRFSGLISPLHPKALSYYNYRYEGYLEENGDIINKIKVIPKLKDPMLMQGYLYIADDWWDIRSADLVANIYGIEQNFKIVYSQIKGHIYMPTMFHNHLKVSAMGVEGYFNYYTSVKYNKVVVNDSIQDLNKKKPKKKSLEIKKDENYKVETDSLAMKRDSLFWVDVRSIPLSEREINSYDVKDSIQQRVDSSRREISNSKFKLIDLLKGGRIGGDSTKFALKYGGAVGVLRDYNFVDGFGLGQKIEVSTKINQVNKLKLTPEIYYTTARKQLAWNVSLDLDYLPMRLGNVTLSAGDVSADFNTQGVGRLENAINSLVWGRNRRMLYRMKYVQMKNSVDIANGLRLLAQMNIADRSPLQNNTHYSLFGETSKSRENREDNSNADLLSYGIGLEYTPEYYYYVRDGKKVYAHSSFPTFSLHYSQGLSSLKSDNAKYQRIEGNIQQEVKTSLFSKIKYEVNGGAYLGGVNKMNFADYRHFNTVDDLWYTTKTPYQSFMLLDAYEGSTNDYWFYSHVNYLSKYILLKRLPFLQGKLFNEGIHLKYLYSPNKKNYVEVGYSVDLFQKAGLGVFCSFDKFEYERFGFKLSFNFD